MEVTNCQNLGSRLQNVMDMVKLEMEKDYLSPKVLSHCLTKIVELRTSYLEHHQTALLHLRSSSVKAEAETEIEGLQKKYKVIEIADLTEVEIQALIDEEVVKPETKSQPSTVNVSKITIREFDVFNAKLWFSELEHQFSARGIATQIGKFSHLTGLLGRSQAEIIATITLEVPQGPSCYDEAKSLLIASYELTTDQRFERLVKLSRDFEEKPSQLLGRIEVLLGDMNMEEFKMWLIRKNLSSEVQLVISGDDSLKSAAELAKKADRLVRSVADEDSSSANINKLGVQNKKNQRSPELCYKHRRFGKQAWECTGTWLNPCPMFKDVTRVRSFPKASQGNGRDEM